MTTAKSKVNEETKLTGKSKWRSLIKWQYQKLKKKPSKERKTSVIFLTW